MSDDGIFEIATALGDYAKKKHDYNSHAEDGAKVMNMVWDWLIKYGGHSGFTASWMGLEVIEHMGCWSAKGEPFGIFAANKLLYPQYKNQLDEWRESWKAWLAEKAKEIVESPLAVDSVKRYAAQYLEGGVKA